MPVSINNTTLTFNDATTQTTSAVTSVSAGTGISVAGGKTPTVTNTGVTSVTAGTGISVSASTGGVTISASGGGVTSLNGQTGAITNTDLYAIGSYVTGRPQNGTSYNLNTTIAGSILYAAPPISYWSIDSDYYPNTWLNQAYGSPQDSGVNHVNTGTWRCVARATVAGGARCFIGLWVRIS